MNPYDSKRSTKDVLRDFCLGLGDFERMNREDRETLLKYIRVLQQRIFKDSVSSKFQRKSTRKENKKDLSDSLQLLLRQNKLRRIGNPEQSNKVLLKQTQIKNIISSVKQNIREKSSFLNLFQKVEKPTLETKIGLPKVKKFSPKITKTINKDGACQTDNSLLIVAKNRENDLQRNKDSSKAICFCCFKSFWVVNSEEDQTSKNKENFCSVECKSQNENFLYKNCSFCNTKFERTEGFKIINESSESSEGSFFCNANCFYISEKENHQIDLNF